MPEYNTHDRGDLVRVDVAFRNADGALIDPSVVKLTTKSPNGDLNTYTYGTDGDLVKDSVGLYHADIDADQSGAWYYRWWSTGTGQAAEERRFDVRLARAVE